MSVYFERSERVYAIQVGPIGEEGFPDWFCRLTVQGKIKAHGNIGVHIVTDGVATTAAVGDYIVYDGAALCVMNEKDFIRAYYSADKLPKGQIVVDNNCPCGCNKAYWVSQSANTKTYGPYVDVECADCLNQGFIIEGRKIDWCQ